MFLFLFSMLKRNVPFLFLNFQFRAADDLGYLSPCKKMKFCLFFEKFRVNYTFANAHPAHFCFLPEPSTVGGNKHLLQLYNDYLIIDIQ